jgi:type I restriction enzyme M protein
MNTGISTYIWVFNKSKSAERKRKVQLIDASHCFVQRRKSIGNKRNDITDNCAKLIVKAYSDFKDGEVYGDKSSVYCQSKIFDCSDFGYSKIVVERPQRDEKGEIIYREDKKAKSKTPVADKDLRDTENVPLKENIDEYFKREVLPYASDAWIDKTATKIGYEIPMTRYFYEYAEPESVETIESRITDLEKKIADSVNAVFHGEKGRAR